MGVVLYNSPGAKLIPGLSFSLSRPWPTGPEAAGSETSGAAGFPLKSRRRTSAGRPGRERNGQPILQQVGTPAVVQLGQVGGEVGEDGVVDQLAVVVGMLLIEDATAGDPVLVDLLPEADAART